MRYKYYLLLILIATACSTPEIETEQPATKASHESIKVDAEILKKQIFFTEIPANGKLTAQKQAQLHFKTSGTIKEIKAKNGKFVQKGTIIAVLDNQLQKNKLQEAQNNLAKAEIERSILMVEYDVEKNKTAERKKLMQNIDTKSGYLQAQTALEAAKINYEYTFLKAPFSGRIANLETDEWNSISANEKFCFLIDDSYLKAEFSILESEFSAISLNQKISISPIYKDTLKFTATISEIDPMVNENGLINIEAKLQNKQTKHLFTGMNVKINIKTIIPNVLSIPKNALVKRSGKNVVFTVKNKRAYWNYVEIVNENSKFYALKKDIQIGDTIIISNNIQLAHDAKITMNSE